jgi:putative tryptophan/tyrosine transport system substrate-binding protein
VHSYCSAVQQRRGREASARPTGKAGDLGHSHRVRGDVRSGGGRSGRKSRASGGNVTGLSAQSTETAGKSVELLREVVRGLQRLAILSDPASPGNMAETASVQAAARTAALEPLVLAVRNADEIASAFDGLKSRADALYGVPGPFAGTNRVRIITLALAARLPAIYGGRNYVDAGGLISYGPDIGDLFRRAADYVDKILRGAKPADIPVEQPTKFDLVINLRAAKAIGLTIPESFLARANGVIE